MQGDHIYHWPPIDNGPEPEPILPKSARKQNVPVEHGPWGITKTKPSES